MKKNQNPPKKVIEENKKNSIKHITNNNKLKNLKNSNIASKMQDTSNKFLYYYLGFNKKDSSNIKENNKQENQAMKYIDIELNLLPYK